MSSVAKSEGASEHANNVASIQLEVEMCDMRLHEMHSLRRVVDAMHHYAHRQRQRVENHDNNKQELSTEELAEMHAANSQKVEAIVEKARKWLNAKGPTGAEGSR